MIKKNINKISNQKEKRRSEKEKKQKLGRNVILKRCRMN